MTKLFRSGSFGRLSRNFATVSAGVQLEAVGIHSKKFTPHCEIGIGIGELAQHCMAFGG
ncbi:MAG: hypothetical protein SNH27_10760 [Rikenellaceae bacterium]